MIRLISHVIYPNLQRYTGAGLCGITISVSWSFLQSLQWHSLVRRPISLEWLISIFQLLPSAIWMFIVTSPAQREIFTQNLESSTAPIHEWLINLMWTCLALSLTVNATVTGLIVFRIMKVYLAGKPTLSEQNLGATGGGRKLRSIIFILIESGMALFAIQLGRLVLSVMLNVIIGPVIFTTYLTDSLCLGRA